MIDPQIGQKVQYPSPSSFARRTRGRLGRLLPRMAVLTGLEPANLCLDRAALYTD